MIKSLSLGHNEALAAIEAIKTELVKRGKAAVVAVTDNHGDLIALLRIDGAPFTSIQIAANKAYTASRDKKPSKQIGLSSRNSETGFDISYYGDSKIVGWGGGIPVKINEEVVGSVGVSGLPELEDIELAELGIKAIINIS